MPEHLQVAHRPRQPHEDIDEAACVVADPLEVDGGEGLLREGLVTWTLLGLRYTGDLDPDVAPTYGPHSLLKHRVTGQSAEPLYRESQLA